MSKMKLLVPTDLSTNSKAAVRFALSLTKYFTGIDVTFYHCVSILKPGIWSESYYKSYERNEKQRLTNMMQTSIHKTIGEEASGFAKIRFVVDNVSSASKGIMEYAAKNKMNFICIATRGAGIVRKILGTHTEYLIQNSKIPVLVIPYHYRLKPIQKMIYLSDFNNLKLELDKAISFSTKIKSELEIMHFSLVFLDKMKVEANKLILQSKKYKDINFKLVKSNLELSLADQILSCVSRQKPDLLIMFNQKDRNYFDRLFLPSTTKEMSYSTKVPILIFSK